MRKMIAVALLASATSPAAWAQSCNLRITAEMQLQFNAASGLLVVPAKIQGQAIPMVLSTASPVTTVDHATVDKFKLELRDQYGRLQGRSRSGGDLRVSKVTIPDVTLGSQHLDSLTVLVADLMRADARQPNMGQQLGLDLLGDHDLEIDAKSGKLNFYELAPCAQVAPWTPDSDTVALLPTHNRVRIRFEVKLDGKALRAELDSGLPRTSLTWKGARWFDLKPDSPGIESGPRGSKFYRFQTFSIGDEEIRNPRLAIISIGERIAEPMSAGQSQATGADAPPDLFLGADWLRAHHVYVGRGAQQMHFTYGGGPVFEK